MTAINLALRNLYGHVFWGNSLGDDRRLVYRTGFNLRGFVREIPVGDCPVAVQEQISSHILHSQRRELLKKRRRANRREKGINYDFFRPAQVVARYADRRELIAERKFPPRAQ